MKRASRFARVDAERACTQGICIQSNDGSHSKIELLGRARIHADGGPGDVALRRKHALPGADCAGRHAIHLGLWDGVANAGEPLGGTKRREESRDTYFRDALPLGSYPGDSIFLAAVRGKQRISFLQFSLEISGARQLEAGVRSADGAAVFSGGHVRDEREAEVQGSGWRRFLYDPGK